MPQKEEGVLGPYGRAYGTLIATLWYVVGRDGQRFVAPVALLTMPLLRA